MVPPTQNQVTRPTPPTYGELLTAAFDSVEKACADEVGPFVDPSRAAAIVTDYERLLAVVGRHMALLMSPQPAVPGADAAAERHRALANRMSTLNPTRAGGNAWADAGDRLGIAHDLVATHRGRRGELLTPEAALLTRPAAREAAVERVVTLARAPLSFSQDLLREATAAQPKTDPPLTNSTVAHVRQVTKALNRIVDKPALVTASPPEGLAHLDALTPTTTRVAERATPPAVPSGVEALTILRLLSYRQSQGQERANAHSLSDLCELAVAACTAAEELLPYAATPLGRVERASLVDQLRRARTQWAQVAAQLYPRVQGLSKAPRLHHETALTLGRDCTTHPAIAHAVVAALPRLASEAAATLTRLADNHELVTPCRRRGELASRWRPLEPDLVRTLAEHLTAAGEASRRASNALRSRSTSAPAPATAPAPDLPGRRPGLGVAR